MKAKSTKISFLVETYPDGDGWRSNQGLSERYGGELSAHKKPAWTKSNKRVGEPHFYWKNSFLAETYPEHVGTRLNQGLFDKYGKELSVPKVSDWSGVILRSVCRYDSILKKMTTKSPISLNAWAELKFRIKIRNRH